MITPLDRALQPSFITHFHAQDPSRFIHTKAFPSIIPLAPRSGEELSKPARQAIPPQALSDSLQPHLSQPPQSYSSTVTKLYLFPSQALP